MKWSHCAQLFCILTSLGFGGFATAQSLQCGDAGCLDFTSTVTVTASYVRLHSYAQADYVSSDYYDITTNAYLYQDYGVVANQTTTTMGDNTVDLWVIPTSGHYYQGGAYGTLTAYYREYVYSNIDFIWEWEYYDPFSYALVAPTPSPSPADPVDYTEPEVPEYIESSVMTMALSWDYGDSTAPPTLSGLTVSGAQVPGGSGSISLYGGYLTTRNAGLGTVNIAGGITVTGYTYDTSSYPWLITITYQIPSGTSPGNYGVTVLTAWGQSNPVTLTVFQISLNQSPSTLDLSTGDTNKTITTTISPSIGFTPVFSSGFQSNPNSTCNANLGFSNRSGTGSVNTTVTAGVAGCSGIFSALATYNGAVSQSATTVIVPPQILIQMLYGEAHGQASIGDNTSQRAIGVATRNRFSQPTYFSGVTTYQAAITSSQFNGISNISNGPTPDVDNAAAVFAGTDGTPVANAACFFSPTASGWTAIQTALQSQTTTLPSVSFDPGCYSTNRQFVVKQSVGTNANGSGAPAFIFEQLRNPSANPAVVQIP